MRLSTATLQAAVRRGVIGVRRETKNRWERRAPLVPRHVRKLKRMGFRVLVQPSTMRYVVHWSSLKRTRSSMRRTTLLFFVVVVALSFFFFVVAFRSFFSWLVPHLGWLSSAFTSTSSLALLLLCVCFPPTALFPELQSIHKGVYKRAVSPCWC